jgi:hypothetical protein
VAEVARRSGFCMRTVKRYFSRFHVWLVGNGKTTNFEGKGARPAICGERVNTAHLSEPDVIEITRSLKNGAKQRVLARKYRISQVSVSAIGRGVTWKHVIHPI